FENKRVLVAIRPAHRLAHGLGMGSDRRQAGGEDPCCPGEEETVLDEIPALVACAHDAALRSRAMTAPGLPPSRSLPPCRLATSASADLVRLDVELARETRVFFGIGARDARELFRAASGRKRHDEAHRPIGPRDFGRALRACRVRTVRRSGDTA